MPNRILSIGNCSYDHGNISAALQKNFAVEIHTADTAEEAAKALGEAHFDLILINRIFDTNGDSGIDLITKLKPTTKAPMMLISNMPEYQQEAIAAGAVPGFGKTQVGKPAMIEAVREYLK